MWKCPNCNRTFEKNEQPHSCKTVTLDEHFHNKELAKNIFKHLVDTINTRVGKCEIISLPCCIHLFSNYDFLAAILKKDRLEIRIGLYRTLSGPRVKQTFPLSQTSYKNCLELKSDKEIDEELIGWLEESYHLKEE